MRNTWERNAKKVVVWKPVRRNTENLALVRG
jgi:hypothetical protein